MSGGWTGVDLDGTLAHYEGWDDGKIGAPIPMMVARVKRWLAEGKEVRIVTARVGGRDAVARNRETCKIMDWTRQHLGASLPVTASKDYAMIELWDDRAVQVIPNTGQRADGKDE